MTEALAGTAPAPAAPSGDAPRRSNGSYSTGARTPEGLERCRMAPWKHGHWSAEAREAARLRGEARRVVASLQALLREATVTEGFEACLERVAMPEEPDPVEQPAPVPASPETPAAGDAATLLHEVRALFLERGAERLPTEEVVAALGDRLGLAITPTRLTRSLKPLGARPRQFRAQGKRRWGYRLADLVDSRAAVATPVGSHDAVAVTPPAPAAPEPRAGIAGGDQIDIEQDWATRFVLACLRR